MRDIDSQLREQEINETLGIPSTTETIPVKLVEYEGEMTGEVPGPDSLVTNSLWELATRDERSIHIVDN